jgi:O-antigen/teichoic acid export membrane protein
MGLRSEFIALFRPWSFFSFKSTARGSAASSVLWTHAPWTIIDQSIISGFNFIIGLLLARTLGPTQFGLFTLGMMAIWFIQNLQVALVFAPMLSISPRIAAEHRPAYFGTVITHEIFIIGAAALVLVVGSVATNFVAGGGATRTLPLAIAAASTGVSLQDFMRRYFYSTSQPKKAAQNSGLGNGLQLAGLISLSLIRPLTVETAFLVIALASGTASLVGALRFERITLSRSGFLEITKRHWRLSKWLLASTLAHWASGNMYQVVAAAFLGPAAIGAMRAANLLLAAGNVILLTIDNHVQPTFSRLWRSEGIEVAVSHTIRFALAALVGIGFIAGVVVTVPSFWFHLLFGQQYIGYEWLVYIFAARYVLSALSNIGSSVLIVLEKTRYDFVVQFTTAIFTLVSAVPFLKYAGLIGAAAGIVVVDTIGAAMTTLYLVYLAKSEARTALLPVEESPIGVGELDVLQTDHEH